MIIFVIMIYFLSSTRNSPAWSPEFGAMMFEYKMNHFGGFNLPRQ